MTVGWMLAYLDRQIIVILAEPLRIDLGLSDTQISLLQGTVFAVFFILAGLPVGRLVDRTNRRTVLLIGMLFWSGMTVACGFATNFWQLVGCRMGVGIGEACLAPASFSIVADMIAPKRRGLAMSLLVSGTSLGSASSILFGGLVLQAFAGQETMQFPVLGHVAAWQLVFIVVGAPGFAFSLLLLTFKEPARQERARTEASRSFKSWFAAHRRTFLLMYGAYSCNSIFGYVLSTWTAVILLRVYQMPPGQLALLIPLIILVAGPCAATLSGLIGDRLARRFPFFGRLVIAQVNMLLQAILMIVWWFQHSLAASLVIYAIASPFMTVMNSSSFYPALNQLVPNESRGQAIAIFTLVSTVLGLAIAPTCVALLTDYVFKDPLMVRQSVILVAAPAAGLGFIMALLAHKPFTRTAAESALQR